MNKIRMTMKYLALVGLLAVLPTTALAQRQTITLASNVPGNNIYVDENGCRRDPSVKVTRPAEWPSDIGYWTASDYTWPNGHPGYVTYDAYATGNLGWAWASIDGADWINWDCTDYSRGMSYYMGVDRSGPYHADYEVSFTMPEYFQNATVEIQYSADDWMNAYMNGNLFVDQHTPVIAQYFDGVPAPADLCGFSCFSAKTVADAAKFLKPGANKFMVRQWEPDGIGGAAFLVKISFDADPLLATLEELRIAIAALPANSFKNANNQKALLNSLAAEVKTVEGGYYLAARDKMAGDLLAKMNGFATVGRADANDQIVTSDGQAATYPLAVRALDLLNSRL
jgi:hypothetical protein